MPSVGTASLDVIVDKQQLGRSIQSGVAGQESHFGSFAKKAAGTFAAAFAGAKAFDFIGDAINGARDLAENQSKVNTVFKDMAPAINIYAKSADAIGLTDNAALEALGTFGNMFDQLKIGAKDSAKMSTGMVDLAADLASFHNADISDVIAAQTSAFRGEYDAVQRFIPTINAAAVEQRALADTHKKTTKELTAQDKAIAVQKLLMEGAGAAMGDFKRTSGGLANSQRVLGARWEELKTSLGQKLLPVITTVTAFLAKNLPKAMETAAAAFGQVKEILTTGDLTGAGPFAINSPFIKGVFVFREKILPIIKAGVTWLKDNWKTALKIAGGAFLLFTGPVTFVVASLALLYIRFKSVREAIAATVDFFRTKLIPAVTAAASWITEQFGKAVAWFKSIWPQISEAVGHVMNVINDIIKGVTNTIAAIWRAWGDDLWRIIKTIWNGIQETVANAIRVVQGIIKFALAIINGDWGKAWDALKGIVGAIWDQIGNVISTAFGVLRGVFGGFVSTIQQVWSGLWESLAGIVDAAWVGVQNSLIHGFNAIIHTVNALIRAANLLKPGADIGTIDTINPVSHSGPQVSGVTKNPSLFSALPSFDTGGPVLGRLGQPQLAVVHGGEHVLTAADVRAIKQGGGAGGGVTVHVSNAIVGTEAQLADYLTRVLNQRFNNGGAKPPWAA